MMAHHDRKFSARVSNNRKQYVSHTGIVCVGKHFCACRTVKLPEKQLKTFQEYKQTPTAVCGFKSHMQILRSANIFVLLILPTRSKSVLMFKSC